MRALASLDRELIATAINTLGMAYKNINDAFTKVKEEIDKEGLQGENELHNNITALFEDLLTSLNQLKGEAKNG